MSNILIETAADIIPGGETIKNVGEKVVDWIGSLFGGGKTKEITWGEASKYISTWFNAIYDTYLSDNYTWKPINELTGSFDMSGSFGIWAVGMVLFDRKTGRDCGIHAWVWFGTAQGRIVSSGMGDPIKVGDMEHVGNGLLKAEHVWGYLKNSGLKINEKVLTAPEVDQQDSDIKNPFSKISFATIPPALIVGIVIVALIMMFVKK